MWIFTVLLTMLPGVLTSLCPHLMNRRLMGNHSILPSRHNPTNDCTSVDYDSSCPGFVWTSDPERYPLFYSKHHMLNLAEAMNLKLIRLKSNGECKETGGEVVCEKMFQRDQVNCGGEPTSILGMGADGGFHLWECPTNHTFSENCMSCKDKKKEQDQNLIFIDDTVCQNVAPDGNAMRPPPIPRDICEVGTIKYRDCESPVSSMEKVHYMLLGLPDTPAYLFDFTAHVTEDGDPHEFLCFTSEGKSCSISQCRSEGTTGQEPKCSGDTTFCDHFPCRTMKSLCSCQKVTGTGTLRINAAGRWYTPICFGSRRARVIRNLPVPDESAKKRCTTCVTECKPNEIIVHTDGALVDSGHLCCSGSCLVKMQPPSTTISFTRPDACKLSGGKYEILLDDEKGNSPTIEVHGHCDPSMACSDTSCFWCWSNWLNFHCHSTAKMSLIWISLSLILVLVGSLIGYLRGLMLVVRMVWGPIHWTFLLVKWVTCTLSGRVRKAKRTLDSKIADKPLMTDVEKSQATDRAKTEDGYPRIKGVPIYMYIIGALLVLGSARACSENHLLSADQTTCVPSGTHLSCTVRGEALLKAGPLGSEACIQFGPSTSKQRSVIKIKTLGSSLKCRKGGSYWTSHFTPRCMSSRRCHLVAECTGSTCEGWRADQVSSEFSHMVQEARLSENGCVEQCGGAGCGCFNIHPSCLFYRNEFQHNDQATYEVFQCAEWVHELKLRATQLSRSPVEFSIVDGETKQLDWGSLSIAIDGETITASNAFHFIRSGTRFAIVDEEFSDIPRKGFLGEIRCPSQAATESVSTACLKADGLTRYVGQLDSIRCESRMVDPGLIFKRGKLPQSRAGTCFTTKPGSQVVEALTSKPIRVILKASMDGTGIQFDVDPPKCSASFKNMTGCYSCNSGSQICVKAGMDQTGATGTMVLKCPSGIETAMGLDASVKSHCFTTHTDKQMLNEDCTYSCGREEKRMHIYGSLQYIEPHDDRVANESVAPIINPKTDSFSWGNWFLGLGDLGGGWFKTVIFSILLAISGIIVVLIGLRVTRSLFSSLMRAKWRKVK
ncbi:glycoprotein precursor [Mudanjiang phlebovirus]|nr:glycoprotein precursor [Mudanjiang phlebovirus]